MEIHIYSSLAHTHYSQAQVSFTHLQSHRTHAYVPFQYLLSAYFSSFSFNTPKSWSTFLHMLKLKFHMSLTLRYTGGGHNDPPSAIYAVEPSRVIRGAQNFGTIPIS